MPSSAPSFSPGVGPVTAPLSLGIHPGPVHIVDYDFQLIDSATMEALADLEARNRSWSIDLNGHGSASFEIPILDSIAPELYPIRRGLQIVRNDVVVWSGMIWSMQSDASSGFVRVQCIGWTELFNHRRLRTDKNYANQDAAAIISDLVTTVNAQSDNTATNRPTWVTMGTTQVSTNRTRKFTRGAKVWPAIEELINVESGVDVYLDPVTRQLSVYSVLGTNRTDVRFGYRTWPNNLSNVVEYFDTPETANRVEAVGKTNRRFAEDTDAMDFIGQMFEEEETLSDVNDVAILQAYAGAEVVYRGLPPRYFGITPRPFDSSGSVPEPLVDYGLGDTVYFGCDYGRLQVVNQAVRVFGMSFTIDDNDNETVGELKTRLG